MGQAHRATTSPAANGRREELIGRIQARYGIDKAQADEQVDAWMKAQK